MSLTLSNGSIFNGISFGFPKKIVGEVVFSTGMTSYVETLTDPSYKGQILVFTFPLIGNYGVPDLITDNYDLCFNWESYRIQVSGVILFDCCRTLESKTHIKTLSRWLENEEIPGLYNVDTRELTKLLREHGTICGELRCELAPNIFVKESNMIKKNNLIHNSVVGNGYLRVLLFDFGVKHSILRNLITRNCSVTIFNLHENYADIDLNLYDGIFLSNGPGNPEDWCEFISWFSKSIKNVSFKIPVFGVCLGCQLLALCAGASTCKMKYGNRGQNIPVIHLQSGKTYITSQNHGYVINSDTIPEGWCVSYKNLNDGSIEGFEHLYKPFKAVQFHPEGHCGPRDTMFVFDEFISRCGEYQKKKNLVKSRFDISSVLLIGSGALSIGQAGEFDYSGSQAIKALHERNIKVTLLNPNIASNQTDIADKVYYLPVTTESVDVILKENPDINSILLQFGGQTALNCGVDLLKMGILDKYNVHVLGTSVESIILTEDRHKFSSMCKRIGKCVAESCTVNNVESGVLEAARIGYPVMLRCAYALGGQGSGVVHSQNELIEKLGAAFLCSSQVLIEKSMYGWKEIEYEVMRDSDDNCLIICNMENFDPVGVHTGESIVICPSQTLNDSEYHMLRDIAIEIAREVEIVGECNIQYALNPETKEYAIIEVNARLSRSSALASKATGYPIAYIAAQVALGYRIADLKNKVTGCTSAFFEPALDYVVVKYPRWDFEKFPEIERRLGTSMKSVGETMGIGKSFEEAIQKAVRMSTKFEGIECGFDKLLTYTELDNELQFPSDLRLFHTYNAFKQKYDINRIHELTRIDVFFLEKIKRLFNFYESLKGLKLQTISFDLLVEAKQLGFSDNSISLALECPYEEFIARKQYFQITPLVKQIDTIAAEFPASSSYFYLTYNGIQHDVEGGKGGIIILGSGPYCIGSSIEFDWCVVQCVKAIRQSGKRAIVINCNPETVSTDYDESDVLFFENIDIETLQFIYEFEKAEGVILSMGGQLSNNLVPMLMKNNIFKILGTSINSIDFAEDRNKFSYLLDTLNIKQPKWISFNSMEEFMAKRNTLTYPVILRSNYILSGTSMKVVWNVNEADEAVRHVLSKTKSICMSEFLENAVEIDFDAVSCDGTIVLSSISKHLEFAGCHSGDATLILPPNLPSSLADKLVHSSSVISKALKIHGNFNIQFMIKNEEIFVIECNLRCSRSLPFVSKTYNVNFVKVGTDILLNKDVDFFEHLHMKQINMFSVKIPRFSFHRLTDTDPITGVEMKSTGEVAAFGSTFIEAYTKSFLAANKRIDIPFNVLILNAQNIYDIFESLVMLNNYKCKIFFCKDTVQFPDEYKRDCNAIDICLNDVLNIKFDIVFSARYNDSVKKIRIKKSNDGSHITCCSEGFNTLIYCLLSYFSS